MMDKVKADVPVKPSCNKVNAKLPEKVMGMKAALTFLIQARPAWQVEVHPVNIGQRLRRERSLDCIPVACPSDYPDFMES